MESSHTPDHAIDRTKDQPANASVNRSAEPSRGSATEQPASRQCHGCRTEIPVEHTRCLYCGSYREDIEERLTLWWANKALQWLLLGTIVALASSGFWGNEVAHLSLLALMRSGIFWCLLGTVLILWPLSLMQGRRLYRETGVALYKWLA